MNPTRYAREIESMWTGLIGRATILSPREWAIVSDWYARSVPLEVVGEAIEQVRSKMRRAGKPPRSLARLAPIVEESWGAIVGGRLASAAGSPSPETTAATPRERWEAVAAAGEPESGLVRLLDELLERLDRAEEPFRVDLELDRRLAEVSGPEELEKARVAVERELEPFRDRMDDGRYARTVERALAERLRRQLGLPRIAPPG